ncbi:MAG: formyltransferase family protein [Candidatus Sumerlaeota bacterium]|nr:formyltransferase family protein [Candidatus Sumerlaeota bacterium]
MRIILLAHGWGGWRVTQWLRARNEDIAALIVHPPDNRKYYDEILAAAAMPRELIREAPQLREKETLDFLRALEADIAITAFFGYILKPDFIAIPPKGCVNIHPSYLPYNRGWHSNVWPILDGSPAGGAIHYIDKGVDTGDVIARRKVDITPIDNGWTVHRKCARTAIELFKEAWPSIKDGTNPRFPQEASEATAHNKQAMDALDCIDPEREYKARDLINLLRGRTYPPYTGANFMHEGRRVNIRIQTFYDEQLDEVNRATPGILDWDADE